jgi:hypothetical protein
MNAEVIFSWLGQLVLAGGGGGLVAIGLFQFLGKSWIENQLTKNLEIAKSEISLLAARKMKLYDQEYLVFPEVWSKLNKAYSSLGTAVSPFKEILDLNKMSKEQFDAWLNRSDLSQDELDYLIEEQDKTNSYDRILDRRSHNQAHKDFIDFDTYLQSNRIFLIPEIKEKLVNIAALMRESRVAMKMVWDGHGQSDGKNYLLEAYETYENRVKPIMGEIETMVQGKLFP